MINLKILITSGGTTEKIDDVRMITNISTGKLGSLIASEFYNQEKNIEIIYICSKNAIVPHIPNLRIIKISSVFDLQQNLTDILSNEKIDAVIHAMAVSDYSVKKVLTAEILTKNIIEKIKQSNTNDIDILKKDILEVIILANDYLSSSSKINSDLDNLMLVMNKTPKIISIIKILQPSTILVAFKLLNKVEKDILIETAYKLLLKNNCDFVLANDLVNVNYENHLGFLVNSDKTYEQYNTKKDIAKAISFSVLKKIKEKNKGE